MKFLLLLIPLLVLPAFAEPLADKTGFEASYDVTVDGKTFTIETISNFDIRGVSFDEGTISFDISSSLSNNFGEMQIPQNVTKGELQFYIDGQEITPKVLQNQKISFVTLEFEGNGTHTLQIKSDYVAPVAPEEPAPVPLNGESVDYSMIGTIAIAAAVAAGGAIAYKKRRPSKSA